MYSSPLLNLPFWKFQLSFIHFFIDKKKIITEPPTTNPLYKAYITYSQIISCNVYCIVFSGCRESYEVQENRYACVAGCKLQDRIPSPESYLEVRIINCLRYTYM